MSFKEMVEDDSLNVFLNLDEFADSHTIIYDGVTYTDVPCVLASIKEKDRGVTQADHAEGIYLATQILHCRMQDIGGQIPERGLRIKINKPGTNIMKTYIITQSGFEMGMLRLELGAYDE